MKFPKPVESDRTSSLESSVSSSGWDVICRICHCEGSSTSPLIAPCYCAGSLRYVHQSCLQRWIKSADIRCCELCKFQFIMETRMKPFNQWELLDMTGFERKKLACAILFHVIAMSCVCWSLYVLIDRTVEEVRWGHLEWPFWAKLIVVFIGFMGGVIFVYIQCKAYWKLCRRWRAYNRIIFVKSPNHTPPIHRKVTPTRKNEKLLDGAAKDCETSDPIDTVQIVNSDPKEVVNSDPSLSCLLCHGVWTNADGARCIKHATSCKKDTDRPLKSDKLTIIANSDDKYPGHCDNIYSPNRDDKYPANWGENCEQNVSKQTARACVNYKNSRTVVMPSIKAVCSMCDNTSTWHIEIGNSKPIFQTVAQIHNVNSYPGMKVQIRKGDVVIQFSEKMNNKSEIENESVRASDNMEESVSQITPLCLPNGIDCVNDNGDNATAETKLLTAADDTNERNV